MTTYVVMRRCVTGFNEYHYYIPDEHKKIGQATAYILPNTPIKIRNRQGTFHYPHDPDITCFPGCSQGVYLDGTNEEYARIFWDGVGKHRIQTADGTFDVTYQDGIYTFSWQDFPFAVMSAYKEGTSFSHPWGTTQQSDKECCMIMHANTTPPVDLALLILSFPLLQIRP